MNVMFQPDLQRRAYVINRPQLWPVVTVEMNTGPLATWRTFYAWCPYTSVKQTWLYICASVPCFAFYNCLLTVRRVSIFRSSMSSSELANGTCRSMDV